MRARIVGVAAALFAVSCGAETPEGPPFRTDNSVQMLMANILDPAAELLWDAVGTVIDETGETHWEPETEEEWLEVGSWVYNNFKTCQAYPSCHIPTTRTNRHHTKTVTSEPLTI